MGRHLSDKFKQIWKLAGSFYLTFLQVYHSYLPWILLSHLVCCSCHIFSNSSVLPVLTWHFHHRRNVASLPVQFSRQTSSSSICNWTFDAVQSSDFFLFDLVIIWPKRVYQIPRILIRVESQNERTEFDVRGDRDALIISSGYEAYQKEWKDIKEEIKSRSDEKNISRKWKRIKRRINRWRKDQEE